MNEHTYTQKALKATKHCTVQNGGSQRERIRKLYRARCGGPEKMGKSRRITLPRTQGVLNEV